MDKRTEKTRQKIHDAFRKLAPSGNDILRISVMDVAKAAGISRSTFYSHYTDIGELANEISRNRIQELSDIISRDIRETAPLHDIYKSVLRFIRSLDPVEADLLLDRCPPALASQFAGCLPLSDQYADAHSTALFWVSGLCGLLREWKDSGCKRSTDEMADLLETSAKALAALPALN